MALLPLLCVLLLVAAVGIGAAVTRRSPASRETTVAAARQHAAATAAAATGLGIAAAVGTAAIGVGGDLPASGLGTVALLVPIGFGVASTAVLLLGELTWPRPEGDVRRARLARRGPLDVAPRWLARLAGGALGAGALVVVLGGLLAGPDGRSVTVPAGNGRVSSTGSPFAGLHYGRPAALGLLVLALLTAAALWVVADRPAVVTADERIEAALRRASAHRVLRGTAAATLVVTGGLIAVSGLSLHSAASSAVAGADANQLPVGTPAAALPWLGGGLAVLGLLIVLTGLVVGCVRAPGVPADEPVAG